MFADDTIIYSYDDKTLSKLVKEIEIESAKYGLKLNYSKCEHICINGNDKIKYASGRQVPKANEAKYLGCMINDRGDPDKEVKKKTI